MANTTDTAPEARRVRSTESHYTAAPAVVCPFDGSPHGRLVTRLAARLARDLHWRLVLVPHEGTAEAERLEGLVAVARDERARLIVVRAADSAPPDSDIVPSRLPLLAAPCPVISVPMSPVSHDEALAPGDAGEAPVSEPAAAAVALLQPAA
jgi:hypothetical protein